MGDHAAGLTTGHGADIDKAVRVYLVVFVALMALTFVTVAVSYLQLPARTAIAVALFVAAIKGSLVLCYFMHLISERKLIWAVLAITAIKVVALLALPIFTHGDSYGVFG